MPPEAVDIAVRALWVLVLVMAPVILPALLAGLLLGMVQAATSINEMTLSFVPKLLVVLACLAVFGGAMMTYLGDFATDIFALVPELSR
jgi:flagellar biosynthetic protein FliQ